ncbi:MAG: AarF/ABC1/UbiB kinase family protein [Candidatus Nanoarchaeia archaeon]
MGLGQTLRDIKRLNQIVDVLFKLELRHIIDRLKLTSYLSLGKRFKKQQQKNKEDMPVRLRMAMEELEGTFIKLGQLLSLRPDLIPQEYCDEFSKLQDDVKPFPYEDVKQIVEEELKMPISRAFKRFEKQPLAAASVGQVHFAILKTGEKVAVKVQRPKMEEIFKTDIDILYHIAGLIEKYMPEIKEYNPKGIVEEFERYTRKELDYMTEARNIDIFYNNFKDNKKIKIPKVYWDYTTKKVLTMEYIEGKKIGEETISKEKKRKVVKIITDSFIKQVLDYGFFHADPHPGNIFLMKNGKVALLDFGIVGRMEPRTRRKVENMLIGLINKDTNLLATSIIEVGIIEKGTNIEQLENDLAEHLGEYHNLSLKQTSISEFFYDAFTLARKYKMKFPTNFVLLIKAMATTEGFDKKYYPEFNFVKACEPAVRKAMKKRTSPVYLIENAKRTMWDFKELVRKMPARAIRIMDLIEREERRKIELEELEIKRFKNQQDKKDYTIQLAILIGGVIIASSIMAVSKMFVAAITGFTVSVMLGALLIMMMIRKKEVEK